MSDWSLVGDTCDPPDWGVAPDNVAWFRVSHFSDDGGELVGPEGDFPQIFLRFELQESTWRCTGLVTPTKRIGAARLRQFKLGTIIDAAVEGVATMTGTNPPRVTAPRRRRGTVYSDDFYREVTELYKFACDHPAKGYAGKPVKWIVEKGYRPQDSRRPNRKAVEAWLDKARRKGYLRRKRGKPGYLPDHEQMKRKEEE